MSTQKPVVSNVTAKLDTLRDADRMVDGAIAISDPDNDIAALVSASVLMVKVKMAMMTLATPLLWSRAITRCPLYL